MIAALFVWVLLALSWAAWERFTHRKTRICLAKSLERIEDLSALCDSQIEFLRDVQPIYAATLKVRDETKNIDRLMLSRAEVARVTVNRLRAFLGAVIGRLDPEVAAVAQRNVDTMMAQLPPLLPQDVPPEVIVPAPPVNEVSAHG